MSKPAHHPPQDASKRELVAAALTEVLQLALATLVGLTNAMALAWLGVLPRGTFWSGLLLGSVAIGGAGLAYLGFEQYARGLGSTAKAQPLVGEQDRKNLGVSLLIVLGGFVLALTGSGLLGAIQEQVFAIEVTEQAEILELVEGGDTLDLVLLTISAVVMAPVCEELLFRHMFFRRLMHGAGPTLAWILPAVAFSLYHFNPSGLVIYVWLGLVFAGAYKLSGRLWVAMAVHGTYNAAGVALLLWWPEAP